MAWAKPVNNTNPAPFNPERLWISWYPSSFKRWKDDLKVVGHELIGEYDLGNGETLYRFGPSDPNAERVYVNVVIKDDLPHKK